MRLMLAPIILACAAAVVPPVAAQAPGPNSRAEAVEIVREMRRIVAPGGVERLETVRIGGIDQWVSIRGMDTRNPVLLMVHGGPGFVSMPTSWYFQRGWEDYFTVVQWDQRGAGKTFASNDPAIVGPTMTTERAVADAEELVAWLRKEFGKEKIFILGHSWGTFVAGSVAQRRPGWLHAYIGVGQLANMPESERRGWRFAVDQARKAGNAQAIRELEAIAPYAAPGRPVPLKDLYVQRKWLGEYGGAVAYRSGFAAEIAAVALSPEYTDADLATIWQGNALSAERLLEEVVMIDWTDVTTFETPVVIFNGRHDHNASASAAAEWFERLQAPSKTLVWFEHSAHEMFNEEPGKFLVSLVQHLRPIAERAGDVPP